ncbi:MAG: hypothetical protein L0332_05665 [Chloroflexi bacterium]|nr:hypothetical protein [Chloroflexota bacterium]MCI0575047.1 hypothetical protein [Chloroflexota bacterium]MCI0643573.1 hypothetical protein [Chloroflexota bacterium]MCI0726195.1 hypothetical protein [Chloroflexota bacterium]
MNLTAADFAGLYNRYAGELEDFWGRRANGPRYAREFTLFGRPLRVTSNHQGVLAAVDQTCLLYTTAPATGHPPLAIHLVVRESPLDPGPPPEDLLAINQYTGYDEWLAIQMGAWGHCQVELAAGRAVAVLTPQLAERPELVGRGLLATIFNNLLTGQGFSMLHCTGLCRGARALLIMAPHNTGKSTLAFRLALAGYRLISDSQIYLLPEDGPLALLGFPVGRVKLRQDVVAHFPQAQPFLMPEPVRNEVKYACDLWRWDAERVQATAFYPEAIDLCLLQRSDQPGTSLVPAVPEAVWEAVMANSLYYDTAAAWLRNLAPIERLIGQARAYHLLLGTDPASALPALAALESP